MSQVFGFPGGGVRFGQGFALLFGVGDPNLSTTPDVTNANVNSIFFRTDAPSTSVWLYRCTVSGSYANGVLVTPAQWSAH
jgi:hypothetical protein